jgi:hypothetical protein
MTDESDTEETFPELPCGHLHRVCIQGDFAGLDICDNEPWGGYTVGSIYAMAALHSATSETDIAVLEGYLVDQFARVQVDQNQLLEGNLGDPDMSHADYSPN